MDDFYPLSTPIPQFSLSWPSPLVPDYFSPVSALTYDDHTGNIVVGYSNGTLGVASCESSSTSRGSIESLEFSDKRVSCLSFRDSFMFFASSDDFISIWDCEALSQVCRFKFPFKVFSFCSSDPSSTSLFSIGNARTIGQVDIRTGLTQAFLTLNSLPNSICYYGNEFYFLIGESSGNISLIDIRFTKSLLTVSKDTSPVVSVIKQNNSDIYSLLKNGILSRINSYNFKKYSSNIQLTPMFSEKMTNPLSLNSNNMSLVKSIDGDQPWIAVNEIQSVLIVSPDLSCPLTNLIGNVDDVSCITTGSGIVVTGDESGQVLLYRLGNHI
ncbi:hypothetical protein RCL1_001951 [Eukaryota sp. TZLM3-RCL]